MANKNIYVGWDSREDIAYQVCEHSIKRRNGKADVVALKQSDLREQGLYTREIDKLYIYELKTKKMTEVSNQEANYWGQGFDKNDENYYYSTNYDSEFYYLMSYNLKNGERITKYCIKRQELVDVRKIRTYHDGVDRTIWIVDTAE